MEEAFDRKDLTFYLYIRSLIEKELELHFNDLKDQNVRSNHKCVIIENLVKTLNKEKKSGSTHEVDTRKIYLTEKEVMKLSSIFFEELNDSKKRLIKQFKENLSPSISNPTVNTFYIRRKK